MAKLEQSEKDKLAKTTYATAPYNFIPLNSKVLEPLDLDEDLLNAIKANQEDANIIYGKNLHKKKLYSGYFDVTIKNKTPLFIGMGAEDGSFFNDGVNPCIPGSSLRGCIKNLFKIITFSRFRILNKKSVQKGFEIADAEDEKIYYRAVAARSSVRAGNYYKDEICNDAKGGFIVRKGNSYYLAKAGMKKIEYENEFDIVDSKIVWENSNVLVFTGPMEGKKHYYSISSPNFNTSNMITLSDNGDDKQVFEEYKNDVNRNGLWLVNSNVSDETKNVEQENLAKGFAMRGDSGHPLLGNVKDADYVIPCFYREGANSIFVKYIAANPFPRISYASSAINHVPLALNKMTPDFTDMVFGLGSIWSSRINFENMYLAKNSKEEYAFNDQNDYAKPLLGPKITSTQLYLDKYSNNIASTWEDLKDDKGNAVNIRGYKMYWHRKTDWIYESDSSKENENFDVLTKMKPLKENREFIGKIHFSGIDIYELGALAYLFKLCAEANCCLKLGGGAPLGLGSIELRTKLFVDGEDYFTNLFDDNGFVNSKVTDLETYASVFETYARENLGKEFDERISSLRTILSMKYMNKASWNEKTRYMKIDDEDKEDKLSDRDIYSYRCTLPKIEDIVKGL